MPMRIMGLDYGHRRIGVAVSDPLGITAQGLETLDFRDEEAGFEKLGGIISELGISKLVVGVPLNLKGRRGRKAEEVNEFITKLKARFHLPVIEWDERFTSAAAERALREMGYQPSRVKGRIDQLSAVFILQDYLSSGKAK